MRTGTTLAMHPAISRWNGNVNRIKGACAGPDGMYEFEAMWSTAGRRVFWDSEVMKDGVRMGSPGGIVLVTGKHEVAELVEAEVRRAVASGLRRPHEGRS